PAQPASTAQAATTVAAHTPRHVGRAVGTMRSSAWLAIGMRLAGSVRRLWAARRWDGQTSRILASPARGLRNGRQGRPHVAPAACVRLQGWCKLAPQKYYKTRAGKRPRSMEETKMQEIEAFHRRALQEREAFWAEQARRVHWQAPWQQVLDDSRLPFAKWFVGGRTNLCFNAVDRWARADPDAPALIWVSTEVGQERILTRAQLLA